MTGLRLVGSAGGGTAKWLLRTRQLCVAASLRRRALADSTRPFYRTLYFSGGTPLEVWDLLEQRPYFIPEGYELIRTEVTR